MEIWEIKKEERTRAWKTSTRHGRLLSCLTVSPKQIRGHRFECIFQLPGDHRKEFRHREMGRKNFKSKKVEYVCHLQ